MPLLTRHLVVSGCHSTNSAFLLIDRSAKSVESFLPSRSRTWRRSRKHQSLANSSRDSSRFSRRSCRLLLESSSSPCTADSFRTSRRSLLLFIDTHCRLISISLSRLSCLGCTFIVGSHCRLTSSFVSKLAAVAPSSLTQAVLCSSHCLLDTSLLCLLAFTHAALLGCC